MSQEERDELKAMWAVGTPYSHMCAAFDCCNRHLRRLLAAAGVDTTMRPAGRPRKRPPGKRVGYEFAGVL